MDLLPFVHMFQFYYYLIWMGFDLVAGIRGASFFVCHWGGGAVLGRWGGENSGWIRGRGVVIF